MQEDNLKVGDILRYTGTVEVVIKVIEVFDGKVGVVCISSDHFAWKIGDVDCFDASLKIWRTNNWEFDRQYMFQKALKEVYGE